MSPIINFVSPQYYVLANTSVQFTGVLKDVNGAAIGNSAVIGVKLSLVDVSTGATLLNQQDIFNVDRGTLDSSGNLVVLLLPADSAIHTSGKTYEVRKAIVDFTYSTPTREGKIEFVYAITAT